MIEIKVTHHGMLTDLDKAIAAPFLERCKQLLVQIRERMKRGIAGDGNPRPVYGPKHPKKPGVLYWVPPTMKQPAGYKIKLEHGELAGYAGYKNYASWLALTRKSGPIRYWSTGQFLSSFFVYQASPERIRIKPGGSRYGGARSALTSNVKLGKYLSNAAERPLLEVTLPEADRLVTNLAEDLEIAFAAADRQEAFERRVKAASLARKASKLALKAPVRASLLARQAGVRRALGTSSARFGP